MKTKFEIGFVKNGFEVTRHIDADKYEVKCVRCGKTRIVAKPTIIKGIQTKCECCLEIGKCIVCGKEFKKTTPTKTMCSNKCMSRRSAMLATAKRHNEMGLDRKVTRTTKMLVCVYTAQGESLEKIAKFLKRRLIDVKRILIECIDNGTYKRHAIKAGCKIGKANQCVICGKEMPEGDMVCKECREWI